MATKKTDPEQNSNELNGADTDGQVHIEGLDTPTPQVETPAPEKRGRGRPRKDAPTDTPRIEQILDEQNGTGTSSSEKPQPKKRGPKGGKASVESMTNQLVGIHQLAAMVTGLQALQINQQEAETLAGAVQNVCDEYGFSISGKTGAAIQLFAAVAMIYGPRALMISAQIAQAKAAQARDVSPGAAH